MPQVSIWIGKAQPAALRAARCVLRCVLRAACCAAR
jgi:hypothetical protein